MSPRSGLPHHRGRLPLLWRLATVLHRGGREDPGGGKWRLARQREVRTGQVRVQVGACQHGANSYVTLSSYGRVIRKNHSYDEDFVGEDDNHWDGDDNWNNVKKEPKIPQKADEEWEAELSDCGERFPAKGPYQCDICQDITMMKEDFVSHMKKDPRRTD